RGDVGRPENVDHLPILTKDEVRSSGDRMFATGTKRSRALPVTTGGSTGQPMRSYNDAAAPTAAMWWRMYRWWGVQPYENVGFVYRRRLRGTAALRATLKWWPTRHVLLDAQRITDQAAARFVSERDRARPALLAAYGEGVGDLGEWL